MDDAGLVCLITLAAEQSLQPPVDLECDLLPRPSTLRKYGLTARGYKQILDAQGGVCAICERPPEGRRLAIDHDHDCCPGGNNKKNCGKCIRGLLCTPCNTNLGVIESNFVEKAFAYLKRAYSDE
jgi:hypothetical protein